MAIKLKTKQEIKILQEGGKRLNQALQKVVDIVKPGITTLELNKVFEEEIKRFGGIPSFKGYKGYPAALCTSIGCEIVHGIPKMRKIKKGEIISLDAGMIWKDLYTDMAVTIGVGKISKETKKLIKGTKEALKAGISVIKAGRHLGDISWAIQKVAEKYDFRVIRDLTGHGVGYAVHEQPPIPNFGEKDTGLVLKEGMVLALEPMFCLGDYHIIVEADGWTVKTQDESLSAHWEHTIVVQKDKAKILTL